jgi:GTP-binding protein
MKPTVFKDRVKLYISAGNGGDGRSSFRREKFVPYGGPDGGDGGNGGSVYLVGNDQSDSLLDLYYRPHQKADHGGKGETRQCYGKRGKDLYIKVPCGTQVRDEETDLLLGEILHHEENFLLCKGGKGGLGNMHFSTPSDQAPTKCTPGTLGEIKNVWLDLKLIAHVGLVGFPNAGKSTLLSNLTAAHPKVAPYPFTTLNPIIGTLEYHDFKRLRIADIPGLIDGAHTGKGLGHQFLRHVERTFFLLFVLDIGGTDGRNPTEDFRKLKEELVHYKAELADVPFRVLANKIDVPGCEVFLQEFIDETGIIPLEICAELGEGLEPIKELLYDHFYGESSVTSND